MYATAGLYDVNLLVSKNSYSNLKVVILFLNMRAGDALKESVDGFFVCALT